MLSDSLKIIFAGTPAFSAVTLEALLHSKHIIKAVYTQPDRQAGRGRKLVASPVKELALQHSLPVYQPVTLRDLEAQKTLADLDADIMIVVAYGLLLPKAVLDAPRLGCINIHASLLPRWRGAAPIQRSILAGDSKTGITIMQMEEGLDTGPMLHRIECDIGDKETSKTLQDRLAFLGAEALLTTLSQLQTITPEVQDHAHATYAHKIQKEEARIDWVLPAIDIDRKIRAFNPWPIAETTSQGQVIRIWEAIMLHEASNKKPGEIVSISTQGIDVATGKNILRILQLQLPGGRALPVSDVLNSRKDMFSVGTILGTSHES